MSVHKNTDSSNRWFTRRGKIMGSASVLAVCLASGLTAYAQEAEPVDDIVAEDEEAVLETVIVRGIRDSLATAQDLKRDSDTFVDAVTAADITALPDRSVAETLQRIPGVAISRFAAADDPDHFSVEGSGVVIRGLTYVRSELNGRDTFSANSGRALGFNDVSPELLGSVEVFKQSTADMVEGGISGTVNLNTRKPFDSADRVLAGSLELNYGDLAQEGTFGFSGIYSDNWETDAGRFGVLLNYSESELISRADGTQIADACYRLDDLSGGCVDLFGNDPTTGNALNGFAPTNSVLMPQGAGLKAQEFDRERNTIGGSVQFENTDRTILATAEYLRAESNTAWSENVIETAVDARSNNQPADGTTFDFGNNGTFTSGTLTTNAGWRSQANCQFGSLNSTNGAPCVPVVGLQQLLTTRAVDQETVTEDLSFNFKWSPNERWSTNFDVQYIQATTENVDISIFGSTFADVTIGVGSDDASVSYAQPSTIDGSTDVNYFLNPNRTFWRAAMDHLEDSEGDEIAIRGDAEYEFENQDAFLRGVRFGGRFAERDQTTRWSAYNWGALSEAWAGNSPVFLGDQRISQNYSIGSGDAPINGLLFYNQNPASQYQSGAFQAFTDEIAAAWTENGAFDGWTPRSADGRITDAAFRPSEITDINEQTTALYGRLDFGSENLFGSNMTLDGNIGVRYVETDFVSNGAIDLPPLADITAIDPASGQAFTISEFCGQPQMGGNTPVVCDLSPEQQAALQGLASGGTTETSSETSFENVLPSFNLKLGVRDDMIVRFGVSRSVTRPELGLMRNFATLEFNRDGLQQNINAPILRGNGGNPFLEPIVSDQIDLSFEWYFDEVGSVTASVFHKELSDVIIAAPSVRPIENDVASGFAQLEASANAGDGTISGFEVAYQQTYDFLPDFWNGFGSQLSYTYLQSDGVPNSNLNPTSTDGTQPAPQFDISRLQGLSDHTINAVGFYENDLLSARLAYNWRSEYLLTTRDVIFPFAPIWHDETGQLDGSIFFNVNENFKVGIQAVNLLDETTRTLQQVDSAETLFPRSYFNNDRRFSLVGRATF